MEVILQPSFFTLNHTLSFIPLSKTWIRILSLILFCACFYQVRMHFAYIPLDLRLIIRCGFWACIFSFGLFFSTTTLAMRLRWLGLFIYLPVVPGASLAAADTWLTYPFLLIAIAYPVFVFFIWRINMNLNPANLKAEATREIYILLDKNIRKLPKNLNGTFNEMEDGFQDNDIDAMRHAYVSGVFTQEYGSILVLRFL